MFKNPFSKKTKKLKALQVKSSYPLFVAMYDYASRADEDLGFKKGELLYITDTSADDWWFAKAKHSGEVGYIPSNYVTESDPLEAEE